MAFINDAAEQNKPQTKTIPKCLNSYVKGYLIHSSIVNNENNTILVENKF